MPRRQTRMRMVRIALYPGSFDPPTHGHLSIIQRGLKLFDGLLVAVLKNPAKDAVFSVEERVELLKGAVSGDKRVQVKTFSGLLVMTGEDYFYISSRFVRDVARLGGDVAGLVPPNVLEALRKKFGAPDKGRDQ